MSRQMSPPQRPGFGNPGNPYQQQPAHSPPSIALPPAKRPRLSTGVGSPQSPAPSFPESPYGPYSAGPSASAGSPPPFNAPQSHASSPPLGTMGPPPKPTAEQKAAKEKEEKEKVTDISDISDAMWGSGVDLREEENYLSSTSRAIYGSQSFNSSFDSQGTISSSNNSFNLLTQGLSTGQLSGSGPASQPVSTLESIEAELDRKHRDAAYKYAKEHEQHLRDPFLTGNTVRYKTHKIAVDQGVHLDVKGLYDPPKQQPPPPQKPHNLNGVTSRGPDGTILAAVKASSVAEAQHAFLEESARYADVLSLISLATNERLRKLLDEAHAIARGRQVGSDGIVPPNFQDIATGRGRRSASLKPESITNSAWDQPRSQDGDVGHANPEETVSFTTSLTSHLSSLALSEHAAEALRIKHRASRTNRKKIPTGTDPIATNPTDQATPATPAPGTPIAATPAADSPLPSSVAPEKPLTKKERERAAKAGQTEEVLHKNANVTAAMQLGFGKKAKKYSWMTGGAPSTPSNPFAKPAPPSRNPSSAGGGGADSAAGDATAAATAAGAKGKGANNGPSSSAANGEKAKKSSLGRERKFGSWREDGPAGNSVQLRDLSAVLGRDSRSKKTMERTWLRLEREGDDD